MTIQELHEGFQVLLDKVASNSYAEFTEEEIDYFLELAQLEFVKSRYRQYEVTTKRREELRPLVLEHTESLIGKYNNQKDRYDVEISSLEDAQNNPIDYLFIVREQIDLYDKNCKKSIITYPYVSSQDVFNNLLSDPFNKPTVTDPVRIDIQDTFAIYFGQFLNPTRYTKQNYIITYIKTPFKPSLTNSVTLEIHPNYHEEVLNLAVRKAIENIESQRLQTHLNEITNSNS